jgi:hypothetical protein
MVRGDHEGYDVLSYDDSGVERLIEVKQQLSVGCCYLSGTASLISIWRRTNREG